MSVTKLAHYSIRTTDLEKSRRFYTQILGFREGFRPRIQFPGIWLYNGGDESDFGVVHLIGVDPNNSNALGNYLGGETPPATGTGLGDFRAKLRRAGYAWRDRTVPGLGLHQVFIEDPSGVTIEMNFPAAEAASLVDVWPPGATS